MAFDASGNYDRYVDGKPCADGTRSFLESRGIRLSADTVQDSPDAETVQRLGKRKNDIVLRMIRAEGVDGHAGSVRYVRVVPDVVVGDLAGLLDGS